MADRTDPEKPQAPADGETAVGPALADALATSETSAPMLDVHAPHESIHSWRDFFIHIATISIGLLIAIGLEQTVEYLHHRHQVADLREALRTEREQNHLRLADQTTEFRTRAPILQTNLAVVQAARIGQIAPEPGASKLQETRRTVVQGWHAVAGRALEEGLPHLAQDIWKLIGGMQPPRTDDERLRSKLAARVDADRQRGRDGPSR
jgi:hypothetical protein